MPLPQPGGASPVPSLVLVIGRQHLLLKSVNVCDDESVPGFVPMHSVLWQGNKEPHMEPHAGLVDPGIVGPVH